MSDSLWPHESQHARPPCPSPTPGVHWDSRVCVCVCVYIYIYIYKIWLHQVLVTACGISFPDLGIIPGPLVLGPWNLSQWTTREIQKVDTFGIGDRTNASVGDHREFVGIKWYLFGKSFAIFDSTRAKLQKAFLVARTVETSACYVEDLVRSLA